MNAASEFPHVLVVDDNIDATEVLALLIETEGFTVATVRTLAQARDEVARQCPDLVFLDLNLPDGSGMSLLAELKADQATAAIPVAILSGLLDSQVREQAHLLGAAAFLLKPFDHAQLSQVLRLAR